MENKVIIDGCNVAKCEFFDNKEDECLIRGYGKKHIMMFNCKHNPNCYFKQLQRAKAELEQYKKSKQASYEAMQIEWNNAVNELRDVKAENVKLKEKINSYICSANCYKYKEAEKYKQALEEIKEIANHLKEDTGKYNIYDLSDKINEGLQ